MIRRISVGAEGTVMTVIAALAPMTVARSNDALASLRPVPKSGVPVVSSTKSTMVCDVRAWYRRFWWVV